MPRKQPHIPCVTCGKLLWHGSGVRPPEQRQCRDCRNAVARPRSARPSQNRPKVCAQCGAGFTTSQLAQAHCSRACYQQSRMVHPDRNAARRAVYAKRSALIKAAGGLTKHQMVKLLQRWKRQGRRCTYCPAPCETVEHVVPLIRGGTNFEGNLAPACRRCNRRKGARLVAEWRYSNRRTFKVSLCVTG